MLVKNKSVFYLSILLNLILISLFSVWLARRGGLSYVISKLNLNPPAETEENKTPRRNLGQSIRNGRILQYNLLDSVSAPNTGIVFLGDSITEQGEWSELLPNAGIRNRGISGHRTEHILERLDSIVASKPDKLFLMIGINDFLWTERNVDEIITNYQQIVKIINDNTPETKVYLQSVLPTNDLYFDRFDLDNQEIVKLNEKIAKLAKEYDYQYVDLHSHFINSQGELDPSYSEDGIHLNGKGYFLWRDLIKDNVIN